MWKWDIYRCPKKMSFLGKTAITTFKIIKNAKVGARIFATRWALRFSKVNEKWLRKWSIKLPTPPKQINRIHCSQYTLINPLSHSWGCYGPWTWHIRPRVQNYLYFTFYQGVEQVLLSLQVMKMQRIIKGVEFWRGNWSVSDVTPKIGPKIWLNEPKFFVGLTNINQLEKLEAAKAAWSVLICLAFPVLASFCLSFWALMVLTGPYWSLLVLTDLYCSLLALTAPYCSLLGIAGHYWELYCICLTD